MELFCSWMPWPFRHTLAEHFSTQWLPQSLIRWDSDKCVGRIFVAVLSLDEHCRWHMSFCPSFKCNVLVLCIQANMSVYQLSAALSFLHSRWALPKLFWIEIVPKTVLLNKKSLLLMIYYILLISPYCRYYPHIEGYKEIKRESSKRRKCILPFRIFNNGICFFLFRTKQRFRSNVFPNQTWTDDKKFLPKPKIFLSSIISSCCVKKLQAGKWVLQQKWGKIIMISKKNGF